MADQTSELIRSAGGALLPETAALAGPAPDLLEPSPAHGAPAPPPEACAARAEDREFFQRELASFVPPKIFDAHCHLWSGEFAAGPQGRLALPPGLRRAMGRNEYRCLIDCLHPGREVAGHFMPQISPGQALHESEWIARQVAGDPRSRGSFLVRPDDDPEWVRGEVRRLGLSGLKCYHLLAKTTPTWEADIPDYLPERIVAVADQEQWTITLHMVKARAVADPSNQHWIRHYCTRYPGIRLILAHAARGFQPEHNFRGLPALTGLENLYFDSSANCEPMALAAIIRIMGARKLLYGSDFHVSHLRGRSVAAADSFIWLYENSPVWGEKHLQIHPVLVGLEHLRALKWACWSERLDDDQVAAIFWTNAARLFRVDG